LILAFICGLGVLAISSIASEFSYGNPRKVALDFGLGLMSLSLLALALFMGANLISKEIRDRTLYVSLARGVSRSSFLIGRILGLAVGLIVVTLIVSIFVIILYSFYGGHLNFLFYFNIFLVFLSSFLLLNVVVFFSLVTNLYLSIIDSIIIFVAGNVVNESSLQIYADKNAYSAIGFRVLKWVVPNFSVLNIRDYVLYQNDLGLGLLLGWGVYGILYSFVLLAISCYILNRKDLV
jgi:ABC-type transport system involved in multi-copper enzyme maturation permease subunit